MCSFFKKLWDFIVDIFSYNDIRNTYSHECKHDCKQSDVKQEQP